MSPLGSLLVASLFASLVAADALLSTESMARHAREAALPARRLWLAHFGQLILLTVLALVFAWSRLHFSNASTPSFAELLLLGAFACAAHAGADLGLRQAWLAEAIKVPLLAVAGLLLQLRHAEWSLLAQGPIVFLGQAQAPETLARNVILLFGLAWAGLAYRRG